ncbi:PREDICTED: tobamovirus multiplication protein 1-like isoform X2 [Lupinus angustifolius]|uniref:tobamovirus multiplication protein 1-like isoform X2 n=1 Tax=Lupinus angustifolius TaxID=3871 RepID=UPI00092EF81E|nr:PREDICTED: tobamovirus multiplication protein 1-like isoform X2 [Lupinus angustifolius]
MSRPCHTCITSFPRIQSGVAPRVLPTTSTVFHLSVVFVVMNTEEPTSRCCFFFFFLDLLRCCSFVVIAVMGFALRTKSFGFGEYVVANHWWDEIDESNEWKRDIYYALCAAYASVSFVALVQLVRIQMRVPEYGWTTQKVFHLMNFIVNGLRAVIFGLYNSVFTIKPKVLEQVLMEVPGLLFFSTYALLVLFWAEIYHQARSEPANKLRPVYFIVNGFIYFIQAMIWVYMSVSRAAAGVEAAKLFLAVISFIAALGFLLYGGRLFILLRNFPIESRGRQKKLYEVGSVTSICCTCFLIRCVMLVEIVPSALVLFILRKLPPRRVSDQYHPIR